ncbi:MAG: HNH endonuclease [Dehalococcoidia bacterium]
MKDDEVMRRFGSIRQWRTRENRAPHKPLLLLLALGRLQAGRERLAPFTELEEPLRRLLEQYGHPRGRQRPEYPFWRLTSDEGIWEVESSEPVELTAARDPRISSLRRTDVRGGFTAEVAEALSSNNELLEHTVSELLATHFPPSLHEDICDAVGLRSSLRIVDRQRRDPEFRIEVLRAYEYRCAMCGYDGKLDTVSVGLDAAHIRWWAYAGPDTIDNALALCALHHRALDRGVVGVSAELRITVSRRFHGGGRARELIIDLAGEPLGRPQPGLPSPATNHIGWHRSEVFQGDERDVVSADAAAEGAGDFNV